MLNPLRQKPHAYHSHLHLLKSRIGSGQCMLVGSVRWTLFLAKQHRKHGGFQRWRLLTLKQRISPIW
jgi:hypothetical protein